ncbi:MAG: SH3 domain-containing protein [Spirochaetaceae bacterium]|nr:SH3 domain-containing protein [Spirochaetaceae bacterium]
MKKLLMLLIGVLFAAEMSAQCLYHRYTKYERDPASDYGNDIRCIRIYRIIDDVSIKFQEYIMDELLDAKIDYYNTRIVTNINGDYISFYFEESDKLIPRAQYKIDGNAKLTKVEFDESRSSINQLKAELESLETFGQKTGIKPGDTSWKYGETFVKLDDNGTYFWKHYSDDSYYWLVKKTSGGYKVHGKFSSSSYDGNAPISSMAVCYAPNKVASVNYAGLVERADISDLNKPEPDFSVWKKFRDAVDNGRTESVDALLAYQLHPYENAYNYKVDSIMQVIAESKKPDFILSCLKSIEKCYGVPVPFQGGNKNPIFEIIRLNDAATLKKVLAWKPELADSNEIGGQFDGPAPMRVVVEKDNIELAKIMLPCIKDVNKVVCLGTKESDGGGAYQHTCNLLSFAKSDAMKQLLIKAGVRTLIPYTSDWEKETTVNDNSVNIRESAGLNGKKIDKLNRGTKVEVIAIDPFYYNIDGYKGHWIQIKYNGGKTGFIFEKYLQQWWQ